MASVGKTLTTPQRTSSIQKIQAILGRGPTSYSESSRTLIPLPLTDFWRFCTKVVGLCSVPISWSARVLNRTYYLFETICRALGFNILVHFARFLRHPTRKIEIHHEPKKIAISKNRGIAFLRSIIHIVPVAVALCEIILNWNTYYLGKSTYNQAFYQFIAKVHEVAIQASLSAIIISYVRSEIALDDGVPFGALFSCLSISRISLLWSLEFWGSMWTPSSGIRKRMILLGLTSISIILAAACGPSSAVLLVPRLDFWPAGKTHIWLNGTEADLWPQQ